MAKVFISYRRDDSAGHAGRIHDRLEREFGRDLLFMDVDAIPIGADFVEVLTQAVGKCDVLLAVIGPLWCEIRNGDGSRRLEDASDFVRIEIATALRRGIPIIPVLLDDTEMPRPVQLPEEIQPLCRRNAISVRHTSFHADMDRLIAGLRRTTHSPSQTVPTPPTPAPLDISAVDPIAAEMIDRFTQFIALGDPQMFIIIEDADERFVQFIGLADGAVLMDLPCMSLSAEQIETANAFFAPLQIELTQDQCSYQGNVEADPYKLTALTLAVFERIYGSRPKPPLSFKVDA